jgi:hypothetical protein
MATTTNYGWTTPDDTDLVKNGADAIRVLGSAIDTSMNTALGTKKSGLVLLNTTSFSGVASQSVNSVFNTNFKNYRILMTISSVASDDDAKLRLRVGGVDSSAAVYNYNGIKVSTSTASGDNASSGTSFVTIPIDAGNSGQFYSYSADFFNPFVATNTTTLFTARGFTTVGSPYWWTYGGYHAAATSYDGFNLIFAGNVTGSVSTYGYN